MGVFNPDGSINQGGIGSISGSGIDWGSLASSYASSVDEEEKRRKQQEDAIKGSRGVVQRQDKGFDFYEPGTTNKIDIDKYSSLTGTSKTQLQRQLAAAGDQVSQQAIEVKPVTQDQLDKISSQQDRGKGEKEFVQKQLVRDNLVSQVASGKVIPYQSSGQGPTQKPSVDITKYLSKEEYDKAVQQGLQQKIQNEAGGTPIERAQQQVGGLDLLSMAQGVAQLPERAIRSGVELFTGQPASNFEENAPDSLLRGIYGKEGVKTYQQQGKEASKLVANVTGNKDLDNPTTQAVAAIGLAGLDLGGLGLGKLATTPIKSVATRAVAETVAKDVGLQGVSKNIFEGAVESAVQKAGRDLAENEVKNIADRINVATTKLADKTPSVEAPIQTPLPEPSAAQGQSTEELLGSTKTAGSSLKLQQSAVERNLAQSVDELPTFQQRDLKANAEAAVKLVNDTPDLAQAIIDGKAAVPEGTSQVAIHNAIIEKAFREGAEDVDLINKAARAETNREISIGAQNLREAQERYKNTPLGKIQELRDVRQAAVARRTKQEPAALVNTTKNEVRAAVPTVKPKDWQSFIEGLKC